MSDDPEACVATPRVSVWEPDWDREKKQEAMQQCTFAVDALLAQVHIKITRPDDAMGSQVLRLLEDTEALQEWFDTNKGDRAVPMTFNRDETDSIGSLVLFETSPGASLSYKPLKLDGTPKKEARTAPGLALETANMTEFQYGEVFATDGFFNVPSDSESPGRQNRAFLSPLLGFMVVAELHASETVINPNTQKRFPRVVQFRIDLLFATTFGVTMKVRRLTHCSCALVLFQLCVPVPVAADCCHVGVEGNNLHFEGGRRVGQDILLPTLHARVRALAAGCNAEGKEHCSSFRQYWNGPQGGGAGGLGDHGLQDQHISSGGHRRG